MFNFFTDDLYYGNTPSTWAICFALLILSIIAGRLAYWVIEKTVKRYAKNTKTNFDDILVDMLEEPLVLFITLMCMRESLEILTISETIEQVVDNIYHFFLIFTGAWLINRLFDALVQEYIVPLVNQTESDLDDLLLPFIRKAVAFSIWMLAAIMGLNNAGYDVGAILAGLGIGGLAFALAAKDTLSNLIAAITIFMDRPFVVGDMITVGGKDAWVREIGMRSTQLEILFTRQTLIVPNSDLVSTPIINISKEPSHLFDIEIPLAFNTPMTKVEEAMVIIEEEIMKHTLTEDRCHIFFELGTSTKNIHTRIWVKFETLKITYFAKIASEVMMSILKRFEAIQLDLAVPTQVILNKKIE